jgi:diaminohydroxyphosphoribosylaminopyrimidine deaminase/5-amino-6-(5-phosphoribosylamino)uracil reductase
MTELTLQKIEKYITILNKAVDLSQKGQFTCLPNPQVGCVIEHKKYGIIGQGWHEASGQPHAEINAIKDAIINHAHTLSLSESSESHHLTIYVTLEPCCHHSNSKKTPPCTETLIQLKPKKVVILMLDPNPQVAGLGVKQLENAGIEVIVLENIIQNTIQNSVQTSIHNLIQKYKWNNRHYLYFIKYQKPYITTKIATSLDGKIALKNGVSKWITGTSSREKVQEIRATAQAILTGVGTVLADAPSLNVRQTALIQLPFFQQPKKWLWSRCELVNHHNYNDYEQFIATTNQSLYDQLIHKSQQDNIAHILIEGGKGINSFLFPYINEIIWFQAPKIMGDGIGIFDNLLNSVIPNNEWKLQYSEMFDEDICRWWAKKNNQNTIANNMFINMLF